LWQFAENAKLHGVEGPADVEVFFGTADQFADFVSGGGDVAMRAVESP
jgi:GH25 family lysozyme M1 (1,4-beta-N-acetylmuramidase)